MTLRPLMSALALSLVLVACGDKDNHAEAGHGHEGEEHGAEEAARGEHGGRLLAQDGVTVELAIAESGTPPTYAALPASRQGDVLRNRKSAATGSTKKALFVTILFEPTAGTVETQQLDTTLLLSNVLSLLSRTIEL